MAGSKREFHYFFRMISEEQWRIAKFDPNENEPLNVYMIQARRGAVIRSDGQNSNLPPISNCMCDCPAAFNYSDRFDKHIDLLNRYLLIRLKQRQLKERGSNQPLIKPEQLIYYNSRDGRFYPGPSAPLSDLI